MQREIANNMPSGKILFCFLFFLSSAISAQILDDSTKQIYSVKTVDYLFESQFLMSDTTYAHPDTLLNDFQYFTTHSKNQNYFQHLGNEGTASIPFYYSSPSNIYTEIGLNAFDLYKIKIDKIKYFRTRSPYTLMAYTQGSNGIGNLGFIHSQNIRPNWNLTLDVNRISSSKQYSAQTSEDRLVDHWDYTISTNYRSKNGRYVLLADWIHFNHKQNEQGGIDTSTTVPTEPTALLADYNTNYNQLYAGVSTRERHNDIHLFQQLKLASGLEIFHILDAQSHKNFYDDNQFQSNINQPIYSFLNNDSSAIDTLRTFYRNQNLSNKFGFKGVFNGFNYILGLKQRLFTFKDIDYSNFNSGLKSETIIELDAGYALQNNKARLDLHSAFSNNGYLIKAFLRTVYGNFKFQQSLTPPNLFYTAYNTPISEWQNDFANIFTNEFSAEINYQIKDFQIQPSFSYFLIKNYLYLDQNQQPNQFKPSVSNFYLRLLLKYKRDRFGVENNIIWSKTSQTSIFRFPEFSNNTNIEWKLNYAKKLAIYLGADVYYRSAYLAYAWSPIYQKFYLQDKAKVLGYPEANAYLKFRISTVKLAFGFDFINQGFPVNGFYNTPGYLTLPRTFFIKVEWPLFD